MTHYYSREEFEAAVDHIRGRTKVQPDTALILGSGLNPLADAVEEADVIPYDEIPHFPKPAVEGHAGRLILGWLEGTQVMVMQGRAHFYEGYSIQQIGFPTRVIQLMGARVLIVTNAAGGLDPSFHPGDLMVLTDHLNMMGFGGLNPLIGPNDPALGPRFPDMSRAYDGDLRNMALAVAREHNIPLHQGVYAGLAGPSFETPAEIRFLRLIGADAVGMSTVPEVTVARHGGMRVLGLSGISNVAVSEPAPDQETSHEEVLAAGQQLVPRLTVLIRGVLARLARE
jgi:purine-nucleoside phosphorylase